jgi:coenzyme F420-0:L-glutamate ligase/coenzyme F420-1:gamma-L-glutamate ligase
MTASPGALARLARSRVAYLATADAKGRPHVVPVCFVYEDGRIYIAIDQKPKRVGPRGLKRVRNIIENPQVSLVADHYEEDWRKLWHVLAQGRAEVLEEGVEWVEALSRLRDKYPQYREMEIEGRPVIRMIIERVLEWIGVDNKQ